MKQIRRMRTMTRQLTELEEQLDSMKQDTREEVDALTEAMAELASGSVGLVGDGLSRGLRVRGHGMHTGSTAHPPRRARSASPSGPRFATVPGASSELLSKARARARSSSCRFATPATRRPDSATRSGRYKSEKAKEGDSWRHVKITLEPVNLDFEPVVLTGADEASCR